MVGLPKAPPKDFPSDGPPPDNFEVPPEAVGAGPISKRHQEADTGRTLTKKMMRCSHISAPLEVYAQSCLINTDLTLSLSLSLSLSLTH